MSAGFMIGADAALVWGGARKTGLLKNFLKEVEWGELDYLLIDSPPGTSDEHMGITSLLKDAGISGAVLVTTPSKVAILDVRRQLEFCKKGGDFTRGNFHIYVKLLDKLHGQLLGSETGPL